MNAAIKKNGLNFGLIIGVISIAVTTIMYVTDLAFFSKWWVGILIFLIDMILGIMAIGKAKAAMGGFISFKEAFTTFFIAMAIGAAIGSIYMFILFNFIDPAAKDVIMQSIKEMTVTTLQNAGMKSEDIRKQIEMMDESDNFGLVGQLKSYVFGLIFYIIIGLIVAAAMKKNRPEFE